MPKVVSGGFALTYRVETVKGPVAVRCLHRFQRDLDDRYRAIAPVVAAMPDLFVPVTYQDTGLRINGRLLPIITMPWVDAKSLGAYLAAAPSPTEIDRLEQSLVALAARLRATRMAHGDLQHGNVLVLPSGSLRVIDYDGMYVPALSGRTAGESGHANYQHPMRSVQFNDAIDRFSILLLVTALRALRADPSLWARYANGDNVLFVRSDLVSPATSALFQELGRIPTVAPLAKRLADVSAATYESVPELEAFLSGSFTATARSAGVAVPSATSQFRVLDASAVSAATVTKYDGEVVTVVGKVIRAYSGRTKHGQPYAMLNFGDWRHGGLQLALWSYALNVPSMSVGRFEGVWVAYTGLLGVYHGRDRTNPEMVVDSIASVQRIDAARARQMLASRFVEGVRAPEANRSSDDKPRTLARNPVSSQVSAPPLRQTIAARSSPVGVHTPRAQRQSTPSGAGSNLPVAGSSSPAGSMAPGRSPTTSQAEPQGKSAATGCALALVAGLLAAVGALRR